MDNQQKAAAALSRANQLKQEGKLDPALKNYLQAAELNPESFWSHYNIGEISAKQGKIEAAVAAYRRAIEINPNHAWCHHFLGKILEKQGKIEAAIALYRRAIEIQPELSWSYHSLGNLLLEQGNIEEAVLACRQAVNLKPEVPAFCHSLGQALAAKGWNYEAAIAFFDAAEKHSRGNSLPAAIESYQKACQFNSENAEYYQKLGILLAKQGKLKGAVDTYKQAIELRPTDDSLHSNLGNALFKQGELEEALTANSKAIEVLNTKLADAYYQKTEILEKQGQIGIAIIACREALNKKPQESQILFKLGLLLALDKQAELALKYYQEALKLQPEKANDFLELGKSLVKAGYLEQVISCHFDVLKDSTQIISIYHKLAIFLAEQGKLDDAVKCFQQVPQLQSRKPIDDSQIYKLRQTPSTEEQIYENLWTALNQKDFSILQDTEDNYPREIDLELSAKHFDSTSEYRVIRTSGVTETDKEFLAEVGLSFEHLQLMHRGNLVELEEIYINSFERDRNIQLSKEMTVSTWQQSILETGYIYLHCPITGKILRSNHSFYVDYKFWFPSLFYRFVGEELFYLIIGSHMVGKLALYFPRLELIISYIQFGIDTPYPPLINRFKSYLLSSWYQVKSYLENNDRKEVAAVDGIIDQMGHTFFNTIPGYQNFAQENKLQQLDRVLVGNNVFMDIGEIFPKEITTEKLIHNMGDKWQLFKNILQRQCMPLMISQPSLYIKEKLAHRIYAAANKKCSQSFQQELQEAKKFYPLILFQIRADTRLWSNQIEGTASIINRLYSDFPNLGVILDGWCCKETGNHPQDELAIEKEKATANQILSLIPVDVKTYMTIGQDIYKKAAWAQAVDLFVGSWGSNLTVISFIANKPGVTYANSYWLGRIRELKSWSGRENYIRPILVESNAVKDRIPNHAGSSYTLEWQAIYQAVSQLITKN